MVDAKTCCEYLITQSISDGIDTRNLLRQPKDSTSYSLCNSELSIDKLCDAIIARINNAATAAPPNQMKFLKQTTLDQHVTQVSIPTATSAKEAWNQWFTGDASKGLFQPLKKFTSDMIRIDRRKYSERQTLSHAFEKYGSYDAFESAYSGHVSSYTTILKEVRKRKREDQL
jgi:hypothetical protein